MDEDGLSGHVPLLSSSTFERGYAKKKLSLVSFTKWVLKFLIWAIFVAWVASVFLFPAAFAQQLLVNFIVATSGTLFGTTGSIFLLYSAPILVIAFLSIAYTLVSSLEEPNQKKTPKLPKFRLWTFPILVDGPFGVVTAAEFIGIFLFSVFIVFAVSTYTIQDYDLLSKYDLSSRDESLFMLELSGLRFGAIGECCLVFLFLPVSRGSFLLRLIDIPFEHATRYHVWLGHLTMTLFTLHGLFYLVAWAMQHQLIHEMLQWQETGIANLAGVISLSAGLLMWVTSLNPLRKQYFELFFYTHQLYVVFLVFFAFHVGDYIFSMTAGGIFLFLLDRFMRFCQSRRTVNVISAKCLPCGTVELVISKPKDLRYNALSFIFLQVRELSWLQWHPFSVSSSPLDGKNHISILIKELGEWTKNLRDSISISPEDPKPHPTLTASVEGPYGHESPYHLTYKNLILVAGGIGISPFLAILRDILHRIKERKPCLPEKVLVIWAVKTSKELPLLSPSDLESICPFFTDKLLLEIQTYVTRESDPPLEDCEDGKVCKIMDCGYLCNAKSNSMSSLVGTGNNIWSGVYVISSTVGFIIILALTDQFYINPFGISAWWFKALLFMACMIASVVIFGGLVLVCWAFWEKRVSGYHECINGDGETSEEVQYNGSKQSTAASNGILASSVTTQYGCRPDFQEIFSSISERWGHVDVGVIVCGPPTLQSSVAKECRSQNLRGRKNQAVFHFNSHSFDL